MIDVCSRVPGDRPCLESGAAVEFRILGPIEVIGDDGESLVLGGTGPRALVAALLLETGRAVTRDRLVAALWESPPTSAAHAVEVYASRLRRTLGRDRIRCRGQAYVADVEPDELDLARFRALAHIGRAASAEGRHDDAADALADALAVWRGDPLACLNGEPFAATARGYLEEERLAVVELDLDARLALGRHEELVPELRALVGEHPTRERLWGRLMLALYRCGRQIDALDAFTRLRGRLRDELGLDPASELFALQRRILTHDPTLVSPTERVLLGLANCRPVSCPVSDR